MFNDEHDAHAELEHHIRQSKGKYSCRIKTMYESKLLGLDKWVLNPVCLCIGLRWAISTIITNAYHLQTKLLHVYFTYRASTTLHTSPSTLYATLKLYTRSLYITNGASMSNTALLLYTWSFYFTGK